MGEKYKEAKLESEQIRPELNSCLKMQFSSQICPAARFQL